MNVSVDGSRAAQAYSQAFQRLRTLPGFDHRAILRAEAGSILKIWAGRVKVAKSQDIRVRVRRQAAYLAGVAPRGRNSDFMVSINTGLRGEEGRIWFQTRRGLKAGASLAANRRSFQLVGKIDVHSGRIHYNHLHFRNQDWAVIVEDVNRYREWYQKLLPKAEQSVGLARQSVVQIADQLGIDLESVPGRGISSAGIRKARSAIASNGRAYVNGSGTEAGNVESYYVDLFSRLPYGHRIGMDAALAEVLGGRAKYIETAYAKGAFDSMNGVVRAFPNVFRNLSAA